MNGTLSLVSVGPGVGEQITPAAKQAISNADVIVSYDLYLRFVGDVIDGKEILTFPLTQEKKRAQVAIEQARLGKNVALLSSGDIGIYGMAPLVMEEIEETEPFELKVLPGVSAANASASLLGAPLSHDFVTLSLSDLLCPWEWIEERAQAAAGADLCLALYNVQSQKRPDGIYKIIDIMLARKKPDTVCGVVRNAYRPDQTVTIKTLAELRTTQFDMFTCIIIGNRFTRRKGKFMFNPRGYNSWSDEKMSVEQVPPEAVWVFSGTSDGNELAKAIATGDRNQPVVVSVASEYGAEVASKIDDVAFVVSGRIGKERRCELLVQSRARAIVDATHPYAEAITEQLVDIVRRNKIPYVRFARPASSLPGRSGIYECATVEEAACKAASLGRRIFLSTGSRQIELYIKAASKSSGSGDDCQWFARIAPDGDSLAEVLRCNVPRQNVVAMQGPFSAEFNKALWADWQIDVVISKDSGDAGGLPEKLEAAAALGIPIVVLKRPGSDGPTAGTYAEVLKVMKEGSLIE